MIAVTEEPAPLSRDNREKKIAYNPLATEVIGEPVTTLSGSVTGSSGWTQGIDLEWSHPNVRSYCQKAFAAGSRLNVKEVAEERVPKSIAKNEE